jgi:RHS repeat-associated protein
MVNGTATGAAITRYDHPDNLGSTNVTSDTAGNLAQWFDYAPYGSVLAIENTGTTTAARGYIGQFLDSGTNLIYDDARYYNPAQGQFLTEDPTFLAVGDQAHVQQLTQQQQNQLVADPQRLDSYAYGRDNPVTEYDTDGRQAVQVTGAAIGDVVGIGSQLYSDLSTGQTSGVSTYIASGLGGAVNGAVVASGGYWYGPLGGFLGGGTQSTISQAAGVLDGSQDNFSLSNVANSAFGQAPFGLIPGLRIKGITEGSNSFAAIGENVLSRVNNGYIQNISIPTAGKIFAANVVGSAPSTVAQSYMSAPGNTQSLINTLSQLVGALESLVQTLSHK